ncbi:MAG: neutral zinc metallopeptidase, partial [Rhizomicrobium sp.]
MRLDDLRPTENVEDRRGSEGSGGGFGPRLMLGGGGLGAVAVIVISLFLGVDPTQFLSPDGAPAGGISQSQQPGAPRADDAAYQFARRVVGSAEDVWTPLLRDQRIAFTPATLTTYDNETPTGCGTGQSSAGPFYCPADNRIYLDLAFFNELADRFGAPGQFARAYVIAHEYGHHIQNMTGAINRNSGGERGAEGTSVRTELQADCYAGVWAYHANQQFNILQTGDV